jgi:acyl carrier protein
LREDPRGASITILNKKIDPAIVNSLEGYMADVLDEVRSIIAKHTSVGVEALTPETRLDEIGVESVDLVEIMFEIEEQFMIEVPYNTNKETRLEFTTIGQITEGVRSILAKSTAS